MFDDNYAFFFLILFIKAYVVGTHLNCIDLIQMSTHNICLYKEVKKKYTGCNLKTTEFLDCALIGVCAVIRSNTVILMRNLFQGIPSGYTLFGNVTTMVGYPEKRLVAFSFITILPADTWRLYNVVSTSMQRHDVASTLRQRCIAVMCLLGFEPVSSIFPSIN